MKELTEVKEPSQSRKKRKKSFWFEFAENKGFDPHKSVWSEFLNNQKSNQERKRVKREIRFCSRCGASLKPDTKFCERCGQHIRTS